MAETDDPGPADKSSYEVIVVGGGPAGEAAARACAAGGLATALVERDLVGGESAYWSSVPTKAMLRPGEALAAVRRVAGAGQAVTGSIDAAAALARRDELVSGWKDEGRAASLAERKIDVIRGHARLAGTRRVHVDSEAGDRRTLTAATAVVVATGSSPALAPIRDLDRTRIWDNRDAAEATTIPERLIVVGGGAWGCEAAQAFRRLGSQRVTLVEESPGLLAGEEPWAGEQVRAALMAEGVLVLLANSVHRVSRESDDGETGPITALITSGQTITADELLLSVGRWPNTADLGLETVGLRPGEPIAVDDRLRASGVDAGWLYAVGDVNERALQAHMGSYQAWVAAEAIMGREVDAWSDHHAVARLVHTEPQVAAVGMTEAQASAAGIEARVVACPIDTAFGAHLRATTTGGTGQIIVDHHRQVVVGATFTGPDVAEMIHSATVAIVGEIPLARLRHAVPAFPTVSDVWVTLLDAALGAPGRRPV